MKRGAPEGTTISLSSLPKRREIEEKIIELPEELWSAIFSHLPLNDFHRIAQVNKQSLYLIQLLSQQFIQSYFSSAKTHPDLKDNAVKLLTSRYKHYQSLFPSIPFHAIFAALNGELDPLQQILSSPNASEWDKYDLLEYAAENGHLILVNLLLAKFISIPNNSFPDEEYVGLLAAAKYGHYNIVDTFLANIAYIPTDHQLKLLSHAIHHKHESTINFLLKDPLKISSFYLGSRLKYCAKNAKEDHVEVLLEKAVGISAKDEGQALQCAAEHSHCLGVIKIFLEKATKITNDDKGWALITATEQGHLDIAKTLLEYATISNTHKKMAILAAKSKHYDEIATVIASHLELTSPAMAFAFKQQPSSSSSSESSKSSKENINHENDIKALLKKALGLSAKDELWALHYAAKQGNLDIVKICLKKATQITNDDKYCALLTATRQGHLDIVKALLEDNSIYNGYKEIALMEAKSKHYDEIATVIESHLRQGPPAMTFAFKQISSSSSSSSEFSEEKTNDNEKSSSFSYS